MGAEALVGAVPETGRPKGRTCHTVCWKPPESRSVIGFLVETANSIRSREE